MRVIFKIAVLVTGAVFLVTIPYLVFIYFFTKEPKPIEAYTFSMSYEELEKRINKEIKKEPSVYKNGDSLLHTRYVTLGKDSARYFFITNLDKDKSGKYDKEAWLEFQAVADSSCKMVRLSYGNKNEYPDRLKTFEDEFIKKLGNYSSAGVSVPLMKAKQIDKE